jgi:hypothetical protein
MTAASYRAIYDFSLMPFALGDALTWNVHTAIRCEEAGRNRVDAYLCLDQRSAANVYQRDFVTLDNSALLFNELFGAFGTHPRLGNVFLYRDRASMIGQLRQYASEDAPLRTTLDGYERTLADDGSEEVKRYFLENAYSHVAINAFFRKSGGIPLLGPSMGCEPDVAGLLERRLAGKRVVAFHMRLRRLDVGYGGDLTYSRDSDFVEWFEFLREAGRRYPDVQFVAMGRRQEKPLEMLQLPNVTCLRVWGLGLGHELTLLRRSDLFIGASSGFAAMAYFSETPYFITRMTKGACNAYDVDFGDQRLPFGNSRQFLVYEPETRDLLMRLLEQGLAGTPPRPANRLSTLDTTVDVKSWEWERSQWLYPGATSYRFFDDPDFADKETAHLLSSCMKRARADWRSGSVAKARATLERIQANFPRLSTKFPEFLELRRRVALATRDAPSVQLCEANLTQLKTQAAGKGGIGRAVRRYLARAFPLVMRLKSVWTRKHRIPVKLAHFMRHLASK